MKARKTIGVLVGGILDDFTRKISEKLYDAAEEYDINIVMLPGKFLDRDYSNRPDIAYEYQYGTLFSCVRKEHLDGIIAAVNCIGCYTTRERMEEFIHQYHDIPCVLVASKFDGYVSVNYDCYQGIYDGLSYLIEKLGCTKIGMVGGSEDISDSIERKKVFEETLLSHGITPLASRYVTGDMSRNSTEAYAKLLDDNPDLEAVFCINDETATGMYEELKRRNRIPGKDISIFGYDNMDWCSQIYPTLSSVSADAATLGLEALKLLLQMIEGKPAADILLPTRFIKRNSFCHSKALPEDDDKEVVLSQYLEMNHQLDEWREKQNRANYEMKLFIMKILQFEKGTDQSYGEILGTIDWLGIHDALLFTFENPIIHLNHESFDLPETLYLKAVLHNKKIKNIPYVRQKIHSSNIYNIHRFGIRNPSLLVQLPLYSNEMLYGFLLCNLSEGILENGEFLSNQMSAAVKMIHLLKTNESIMQQLENSLAILQENNLKLDSLSKSDPLTGIRNRRGFFLEAEPLRKLCMEQGKTLTVMYVDMNNLKIINDRYSHEEGDFSLNKIAEILEQEVGRLGVVARIGGDEYACALATDQDKEALLTQIYDAFTHFNETSDKPYNVTVSAGAYQMKNGDYPSLEDAMTLADEQLYEVKKIRKKDVAKT